MSAEARSATLSLETPRTERIMTLRVLNRKDLRRGRSFSRILQMSPRRNRIASFVLPVAEEMNLRDSILTSFMPPLALNPGHCMPQKIVFIKRGNDGLK